MPEVFIENLAIIRSCWIFWTLFQHVSKISLSWGQVILPNEKYFQTDTLQDIEHSVVYSNIE